MYCERKFVVQCCGNSVSLRKHKNKSIFIFTGYIQHTWGILLCMIYVKLLQIIFPKVVWLLGNKGMEGVIKNRSPFSEGFSFLYQEILLEDMRHKS